MDFSKEQTLLTGLKKFVNYNITLFASTVKGNGNRSGPIFVITDQDSKWYFFLFDSILRSYSDSTNANVFVIPYCCGKVAAFQNYSNLYLKREIHR